MNDFILAHLHQPVFPSVSPCVPSCTSTSFCLPCPFSPLSPLSLSLPLVLYVPLFLFSPTSVSPSLPKPSIAPSLSSLCPFVRSVLLSPCTTLSSHPCLPPSLCLFSLHRSIPLARLSIFLSFSLLIPPSPSASLSVCPLCLSLSPSSLSLSQSWLGCPPLQPFLWLLMSRGAFEVARAGMGGSPRGAEGAAAAKALMRPPLRPSRRDLNSFFSLEPALIGLGRAPFWLMCSLQEPCPTTWPRSRRPGRPWSS